MQVNLNKYVIMGSQVLNAQFCTKSGTIIEQFRGRVFLFLIIVLNIKKESTIHTVVARDSIGSTFFGTTQVQINKA